MQKSITDLPVRGFEVEDYNGEIYLEIEMRSGKCYGYRYSNEEVFMVFDKIFVPVPKWSVVDTVIRSQFEGWV